MIDDRVGLLLEGSKTVNVDIEERVAEKILAHLDLVLQWNNKINLTAITGQVEAVEKHLIDSVAVLQTMDLNNLVVADLGSGPGFPGIPLAVCCPQASLMLVEASKKKASFLREVVERLHLENVRVCEARAEDLGRNDSFREKCDVVVSRALAELRVLAEYSLPMLKLGGKFIAFKGPNVGSEVTDASFAVTLLGGDLKKIFEFDLPYSQEKRSIVIVEKIRVTPAKFPRRTGIPSKRPL